jgi:hypothetical protein
MAIYPAHTENKKSLYSTAFIKRRPAKLGIFTPFPGVACVVDDTPVLCFSFVTAGCSWLGKNLICPDIYLSATIRVR